MHVYGHRGTAKLHGGGAGAPAREEAPAPEGGGKKHGHGHGKRGSEGVDRLSGSAKADFGTPPWGGDDDAVQAFGDSCVATSLQRELRAQDPEAYRRQVDQLAATGETTLSNGAKLSLAPDVLAEIKGKGLPRQLERSALMQAAIMAYAQDKGYVAAGGGVLEGDVQALGQQLGVNLAMADGKLAVGQYVGINENGGYHLVKVVGVQKPKHHKKRYVFSDGSARETVMKKKNVAAMKRAGNQDAVGTLGTSATTVSSYRSRR